MKMQRTHHLPTVVYEGSLAPFRFQVQQKQGREARWIHIVRMTRTTRYRLSSLRGVGTLKEAKAIVVRWWLENRVQALETLAGTREMVAPDALAHLHQLARAWLAEGDSLAPLAFRDCLEEQGLAEAFHQWIVVPGRKARVAWPEGWEFLGAGCGPRPARKTPTSSS